MCISFEEVENRSYIFIVLNSTQRLYIESRLASYQSQVRKGVTMFQLLEKTMDLHFHLRQIKLFSQIINRQNVFP